MKKLIYLIVAIVVLGLIVSGCLPVVPLAEKDETSSLMKAKPLKPPSGAHYNLNIIGKKSTWSGGGSYNNPDRHTMFVPEDTTADGGFLNPETGEPCVTANGEPGVTIEITQCGEECDDFAVLDGNAFDDCTCELRLAPGKYEVWMVAKAKPAKKDEPEYYTDITGWIRYTDPDTDDTEYFKSIGSVTVKGKKWVNASDIIYVSCSEDTLGIVEDKIGCNGLGMWVFDYLYWLTQDPYNMEDTAYFWQYDNHGNKLVKVRFYKK